MEREKFAFLIDKYIQGTASEEETAMLLEIYQAYQDLPLDWEDTVMGDKEEVRQALFAQISRQINNEDILPAQRPQNVKLSFLRYTAAASVLLFLSISVNYLLHKHQDRQIAKKQFNDSRPGKDQATLTLANGKKILLSGASNGQLAGQAGLYISKTSNNVLLYTIRPGKDAIAAPSQKNTLTTANGEQYQVLLPDGSHVWLNAASSLTYPVAFAGKSREVELSGEAYFEVAHNKAMPFKVITKEQEIQVLGTHFNVNAYNDEPVTATTLLEGSVKVTLNADHKAVTIVPGQQAIINQNGMSVRRVDTDDAVAWKNGYFLFDNENLESIMRKISRWYNVRVEYTDSSLKTQLFSGSISRYTLVSQVIRTLELTNAAHFHIGGDKILVTH